MLLSDLRERIRDNCKAHIDSYDNTQVDRAIQFGISELMRRAKLVTSELTKALTANNPEFTITTADFASNRIQRAELGYVDQGVWAVGTTYAVNDLVQGDGSPDAYFYVCKAVTTGNEPPNTTHWTRVLWKRGTDVELIDYETMAKILRGDMQDFIIRNPWYFEGGYPGYSGGSAANPGKPRLIAFRTPTIGYVYPIPDQSYPLVLGYWEPLTNWTPGTEAIITIPVPDEYLVGVYTYAAPAYLRTEKEGGVTGSPLFQYFVKEFIPEVRGSSRINQGVAYKNPSDFR